MIPRRAGPALGQPTFNWKASNKYKELQNFKIDVNMIFMTNTYNAQENDKVPSILKWLGREGLQFVQTLNDVEQEKCKTSKGLCKMLHENFKPQHNKTVLSL